MLLDEQDTRDLKRVLQRIASDALFLFTGNTFRGVTPTVTRFGKLPILTQMYIAGQAANQLGPEKLKLLNSEGITAWMREQGHELSSSDEAQIERLNRETEKWVSGRLEAWNLRLDQELNNEDRSWAAELLDMDNPTNADIVDSRQAHIAVLAATTSALVAGSVIGELQRLLVSEGVNYYQQGQVAGLGPDTVVYKLVRPGACPWCLQLHVKPDGSPKKYRLRDIRGNSNVGNKAAAWRFTLGPVHPHCYCVLYVEHDGKRIELDASEAAGPEDDLELHAHDCGPITAGTLFDEQVSRPTSPYFG